MTMRRHCNWCSVMVAAALRTSLNAPRHARRGQVAMLSTVRMAMQAGAVAMQ
jgi:hypothetical protein